ncbi:MAG TPA: rhomboid family intramembrane serine protease [Desulfosalsimonadaceae bacterium]|nr:rhomboid family intramembrane serine protease [Desulfosalsimonadaceae bacterium]
MLQLFANLSAEQANICSLVLASAGIACRIRRDPHGWAVWVQQERYEEAYQAMAAYFRENRNELDWEMPEKKRSFQQGRFVESLFAAVFLMAFHISFQYTGVHDAIVRRFGASAEAIWQGEFYRAVTALMIHADAVHLAGNMLGIAVFGAAVTAEIGWGLGWLLILASGICGNLLNAGLHAGGHLSIGASTAVFGAVGMLVGLQMIRRFFRQKGRRLAVLAPLAGGLALLGFMGSGPNVDIMAHLFGFAAGIAIGAGCGLFYRAGPAKTLHAVSLALVFALIFLAWTAGG